MTKREYQTLKNKQEKILKSMTALYRLDFNHDNRLEKVAKDIEELKDIMLVLVKLYKGMKDFDKAIFGK